MSRLSAGFLAILLSLVSSIAAGQDLSWPTFRHDQNRTGRSEGTGDITEPVVKWTYALGGQLGAYYDEVGRVFRSFRAACCEVSGPPRSGATLDISVV